MSTQPEYRKCSIRDGAFIEPCDTLKKTIDGGTFYRGKGLQLVSLTNLTTLKPSRSFVVLRCEAFRKNGIALNCCPFCGERIDAPFQDGEEAAA